MVRRFAFLALLVAAFLVLAVPALAANGARADYTTSDACAVCHTSGQPANAPKVYNDWLATAHGSGDMGSVGGEASISLPYGSVCAGCHLANYDPTKVTPVNIGTVPSPTYIASPSATTAPQALGNAPFSENAIGCSSCHYGANVNGVIANAGNDVNDTAHMAPFGDMANAEICGACHTRFAYTTSTITVAATPTPGTTLIQPQMAVGYPMLGKNYQPLSTYLNIPSPGWTPTPNPAATTAAGLQTYFTIAGVTTPWQTKGHVGSAAQYSEWKAEGHANSLVDLKAAVGANPPASCLQCHSADYRIAPDNAKPTGTEAKYGITCVGCHTPHPAATANTSKGVWDESLTTQLVGNPSNPSDLCGTCHNSQIGDGVLAAGTTVYENQQEVMNGTGAIGVPQGLPGVHKGKCVQCHMAPTSTGYDGIQLGGNHTFKVIMPNVSVSTSPRAMPFSACSTCHSQGYAYAIAKIKAKRAKTAGYGGDNALWLQDTIDQRQAAMKAKYNLVAGDLHAAGTLMGFTAPANVTTDAGYISWLNTTINAKGAASMWTPDELKWQQAYTDWTYVAAEGSWGIHNWQYDSLVITAAETFANQVAKAPQTVKLKLSKTNVKRNSKVTFSGSVSPATAGTVHIQKSANDIYGNWRSARLSGGKYSITVKMTSAGTFHYRAFLAPSKSYAGGTSGAVKLRIRK